MMTHLLCTIYFQSARDMTHNHESTPHWQNQNTPISPDQDVSKYSFNLDVVM